MRMMMRTGSLGSRQSHGGEAEGEEVQDLADGTTARLKLETTVVSQAHHIGEGEADLQVSVAEAFAGGGEDSSLRHRTSCTRVRRSRS